ncbi:MULTISPECIES: tetratricopeptide repeat protein [unclassified Pedobacter]|uniref:tetratricopeptide repeat protein n=1 Tax=unclassified Pedobacter TaxID=2628915 RepID=UPI001D5F5FDE|nr:MULTISPECIES: hypothetical protein [unclassified Pedobacter]CAH0264093.1 Photosystem I assembly protein Ycf3 [Pedobacter sp. Bi36]CAH0290613.1 Photosystem I assembly protein Ycf3 [Pedobacter sp. Bi126]
MDKAGELHENEYQAAMDKVWLAFDNGEFDLVEEICNKLIVDFPLKSSSYNALGHVYKQRGHYQKAADELLLALEKDIECINTGYIAYWLGKIYDMDSFIPDEETEYIYDKDKSEYYFSLARKQKSFPEELLFDLRYSLKGQEKIELFQQGIEKFPNTVDFYLLLAGHYQDAGMYDLHRETLELAMDRGMVSPSLFFNIGFLYYRQSAFESALINFKRAMSFAWDAGNNWYAILYMLGRSAVQLGLTDEAAGYFKAAYEGKKGDPDYLFGFLGLLNLYVDIEDYAKIEDLMANVEISKDLIENAERIMGGPVFLADHFVDTIELENLDEIYSKLIKLRFPKDKSIVNGKLFLIKYTLAVLKEKHNDQYKFIKGAKNSLNIYHYDFLDDLLNNALSGILYNKTNTPLEIDRYYSYLIDDLGSTYRLAGWIAVRLKKIFLIFFEKKQYDRVIALARYFNLEQLTENDCLFNLAYSYSEKGENPKAKEFYEHYLKMSGESTAVLNNLGVLYAKEDDHATAIVLYRRGLLIETEHPNLISNLARAERNLKIQQENQLAVELLKSENDYVREKLLKFIQGAKIDEACDNGDIPVPLFKFQKLAGVDKARAESLVEQWLSKGYLINTGERDGYRAIIYRINPLLEKELIRIKKYHIPKAWIDGFTSISVEVLEKKGFFDILQAIDNIQSKKYRALFERDFKELFHIYLLDHLKASVILSGSLVELALTYFCESRGTMSLSVRDPNGKAKNKALYDCVLSELITHVQSTKAFGGDFGHLSNLSRIYRNFVHPGKELKDPLDQSKADLCFISTVEILKKILI